MVHLDELPAEVGWFGKSWDSGCTPDIQIDVPAGEICHHCFVMIEADDSGVVTKNGDGKWIYLHADCWGAVIDLKQAYVEDVLGDS